MLISKYFNVFLTTEFHSGTKVAIRFAPSGSVPRDCTNSSALVLFLALSTLTAFAADPAFAKAGFEVSAARH
ncbi:MAG: hypothetical protein CFE27_15620 [Alphaproteobacteria bacterium PA1]|nr:MAG: hypothetical protein CFE27_15620 [Alphaproteobacteria bacterium PA1]